MKSILLGVGAVLLFASGCAHRDYEYGGISAYSGDPAAANTKGAGARVMMGGSPYNDTVVPPGGLRSRYASEWQVVVPDDSTPYQRGSDQNRMAPTQGSGAQVIIEDATQTHATSDVNTSDSGGSTALGDSSAATTQGSGARTMIGGSAGSDLAVDDVTFLKNASQQSLAEARMGQLAVEKARNESLKEFGQQLVTSHTQANEELKSLAHRKGVQVPLTLSLRDQEMLDRLSSASGGEFDRLAQKEAVEAHVRAVRDFQFAASRAKDPEVKAFAERTLPVLEQHLEMARDLGSGSSTTHQGGSNSP